MERFFHVGYFKATVRDPEACPILFKLYFRGTLYKQAQDQSIDTVETTFTINRMHFPDHIFRNSARLDITKMTEMNTGGVMECYRIFLENYFFMFVEVVEALF